MSNIGVWIETDHNGLKPANFGVVTAAKAGGTVYAFVFSEDGRNLSEELGRYGVDKVVFLNGDGPVERASVMADAVREYKLSTLLGLSSFKGRDLLARCACELEAPLALDATGIDLETGTVLKSHFSGKTTATIVLKGDVLVCGLRPNVIEAQEAPAETEEVVFSGNVPGDDGLKVLEVKKGESGKQDLTEADIIITGGRPMDSADNFKILEECAEQLGAAVGASRATVDAGFAPHSMQVGQTGKTVSPKLYIGCGLSGSVQHFAGMKTSKVIVGINTDKDAPIFGKCDYGIEGDLFEVVPALTDALKAR
ncbi:MAG: electron transfer flavoprotein subunit alpha/FixB family protein [Thermodesulfobacteriota bacterium]